MRRSSAGGSGPIDPCLCRDQGASARRWNFLDVGPCQLFRVLNNGRHAGTRRGLRRGLSQVQLPRLETFPLAPWMNQRSQRRRAISKPQSRDVKHGLRKRLNCFGDGEWSEPQQVQKSRFSVAVRAVTVKRNNLVAAITATPVAAGHSICTWKPRDRRASARKRAAKKDRCLPLLRKIPKCATWKGAITPPLQGLPGSLT